MQDNYDNMIEVFEGQRMPVHAKAGYNLVLLSRDYGNIIGKMTASEARAQADALLSAADIADGTTDGS